MAKLLHMAAPAPVIADADARRHALDVERSWIVEAPAGSGKTGLLIQRYLRLLAHESVTAPEQVLAITFTRAATEEIRERVLRALAAAADKASEPSSAYNRETQAMASAVLARDHAFGWNLLEEPHRLRVRTIDSVCAEIARSLPILSGGNGLLTPVEDASAFYREASRRTWLRLGGPDLTLHAALRMVLLHRDGELHTCESLVASMLAERDQWGSLVPLRAEEITDEALDARAKAQLNATLEKVICATLTRLTHAFPESLLRRLTSMAQTLSDRPAYQNGISPLAICRELHTSPSGAMEHLHHWRALAHLFVTPSSGTWRRSFNSNVVKFVLEPPDKPRLLELIAELGARPDLLELLKELGQLPPTTFPDEQWPVTKALFHILRHALAELQLVFSEQGACDFTEPALLARYVLDQQGGAGNLEDALGIELKHLLVDEMQDTSTRQYELIERLTHGWADERKTVFLVGDPKQSIYLFRQARVERFIETMRTGRLGDVPVSLLQLTANFRSQAALVDNFNQDFGVIFPREITRPEDVNYVQATATRPSNPASAGSVWHLSIAAGDTEAAKQFVRQQATRNARDLRRCIEAWRQTPLPPGRTTPWKIAILVQSRVSLARILPELQREPSLPLRALKIDRLEERREILDLLALTRAMLHPADRTAWLAVLHAPWCGLDLGDLHLLTGSDDSRFLTLPVMQLIDIHAQEISVDGIARLERAWPVLHAAVNSVGRIRLPELVERTWRSLGGDAALEEPAFSNALRFFDLLRTLDRETGEVSLAELTRRLHHLYAASAPAENAVEIATIHGAKGLEWDVVFVPELQKAAPPPAPRLLEWEELLDGGVILAPITPKGGESEALLKWLRGIRARREAAERKRLFYVACTRAREELHLFGVATQRADQQLSPNANSLLQAAWPAAEDRLLHLQPVEAAAEAATFDLAAAAEEQIEATPNDISHHRPMLERLPLDFVPTPAGILRRSPYPLTNPGALSSSPPLRSVGSFATRTLGITIHTFLEDLAARLAAGAALAVLLRDLPSWQPRVQTILRTYGLSPQTVSSQAHTVLAALTNTLRSPVGLWLLAARSTARNELALTTWEQDRRQYRIDRIFRAGAEPQSNGDTHLWIIDYKSASDPAADQDEAARKAFLARERERYQPQLETYASLLAEPQTRLGLWFPLLGRLEWWPANGNVAAASPISSTLSAMAKE